MTLSAIESRLVTIAAAWALHLEACAAEHNAPLFDHAQLTCDSGFVWVLVRSPANLNECGQALRNCCRRGTDMYERYCEGMAVRSLEFWALREPSGQVRGLALINRVNWEIAEARGLCNRVLTDRAAELDSLDAYLVPLRRRACEAADAAIPRGLTEELERLRALLPPRPDRLPLTYARIRGTPSPADEPTPTLPAGLQSPN
jgi:hypothetical protein